MHEQMGGSVQVTCNLAFGGLWIVFLGKMLYYFIASLHTSDCIYAHVHLNSSPIDEWGKVPDILSGSNKLARRAM